jgi:hypothetical protein
MARKGRWCKAGRQEFFGSLFAAVVACTEGNAPMTWRGRTPDLDHHPELHVFEAVTELVGGPNDGAEVLSGFLLDVNRLALALTMPWLPAGVSFNCRGGPGDYAEAHVTVTGAWRGAVVSVFVFAAPPPDEGASWLALPDGSFVPKGSKENDDGEA